MKYEVTGFVRVVYKIEAKDEDEACDKAQEHFLVEQCMDYSELLDWTVKEEKTICLDCKADCDKCIDCVDGSLYVDPDAPEHNNDR